MESWAVWLVLGTASLLLLLLLLLLGLRLRGPGGGRDLTGPPGRSKRSFTPAEAGRLADLVGRGDSAEAVRLIRAAGHDEAEALRIVALIERLMGRDGEAAP